MRILFFDLIITKHPRRKKSMKKGIRVKEVSGQYLQPCIDELLKLKRAGGEGYIMQTLEEK